MFIAANQTALTVFQQRLPTAATQYHIWTRNTWQNPAVARQAQCTHSGEDTLCSDQIVASAACATLSATRSFHSVHTAGVLWVHSALVPGDLDLWLWHSNSSERKTKHVFRVNLAQICSLVPAIHCRMRVPRIKRVSTISRIWHINGRQRQTISVNSGVSGQKFTKFLHDIDRTYALLTRPSAFPSCHPFWNASPKKEACPFRRFRPVSPTKSGCHGNVPRNQYQTEHLHQNVYTTSENLVKIGLVVSDICLLQAIVKKERKKRKESNRGIT